ncbi:hypothetical protein AAHA92_27995 [Salvia divinorum]|uniref:Uncharacterized protein n=1 Tax=Salvia divinorum TaxID=28513 RepID=A0ABD1G5I3_SALDI
MARSQNSGSGERRHRRWGCRSISLQCPSRPYASSFISPRSQCLAQLTGYTGINYTSAEFSSAMLNLSFPDVFSVLNLLNSEFGVSCKNIRNGGLHFCAFVVTLYQSPESLTNLSSPKLRYEYIGVVAVKLDYRKVIPCCRLCRCFSLHNCTGDRRAISYLKSHLILNFYLTARQWLDEYQFVTLKTMFGKSPYPYLAVPFSLQSSIGDHDICCAWYYLLERWFVSSLLGSIIIVVGFYSVMCGKAKEVKAPWKPHPFSGLSCRGQESKAGEGRRLFEGGDMFDKWKKSE